MKNYVNHINSLQVHVLFVRLRTQKLYTVLLTVHTMTMSNIRHLQLHVRFVLFIVHFFNCDIILLSTVHNDNRE